MNRMILNRMINTLNETISATKSSSLINMNVYAGLAYMQGRSKL